LPIPPPDAAELVRGAHLQSANKQSVAATAIAFGGYCDQLSATPSETLWFEISLGRTALRAFERRRPCDSLAPPRPRSLNKQEDAIIQLRMTK
jgi:hypothetical protein